MKCLHEFVCFSTKFKIHFLEFIIPTGTQSSFKIVIAFAVVACCSIIALTTILTWARLASIKF